MVILWGKVESHFGFVYIIYFDLLRQSSYFFPLRLFYHGGIFNHKKGLDRILRKKKSLFEKRNRENLIFFKKGIDFMGK